MAYQNESYTGLSYTGVEFTVVVAYVDPSAAVYVGSSYTNPRYTSQSYTSVADVSGTTFDQVGTAAVLTAQGFAGGFPFSNQGTTAQVNDTGGYAGFEPDVGGVLENDSSDQGPLSYQLYTPPAAGTLTTYAGGAFTWDIDATTPPGRYLWQYVAYANGLSSGGTALGEPPDPAGIATVYMEHGEVFASVSPQGFAGSLTLSTFDQQGTLGTVNVTGYAGDITLTFDKTGTSAQADSAGFNATITTGSDQRGTRAELTPQGFAGFLVGDFDQQGTAGIVTVTGNAGIVETGTFFNEAGTAANNITVSGFAGTLTLGGGFAGQGTAADVTPDGGFGTILYGFAPFGTAASVDIQGFEPSGVGIDDIRLTLTSPEIRVTMDAPSILMRMN